MSEPESNQPKNPAGTPAPDHAPPDDAGTQALSEALRSSFIIVRIIMIGLVVVFFASGFFTVDAQHKAIILRMGKPVGEGEAALLGPGLHFAFPRPIDEVVRMTYTASQTADSTLGWYQTVSERQKGAPLPPPQTQLDPNTISYVLSGDTNIIHVMATVTYRITDPIKFNFDFADAPMIVTNDLNNALLLAASHFSVDDVLSKQPTAFMEAVRSRMDNLTQAQDLGITIDSVNPQTSAPLDLAKDFQRVALVTQEASDSVVKANNYSNTVVGNALAAADTRVKVAQAAAARMVGLIGAEQTNFSRLLPDYRRDPELVKTQLLAETLKKALTSSGLTEVLPDMDGRQLRFHLSPPAAPLFSSTNQPGQ